jgi:hypothetical protein
MKEGQPNPEGELKNKSLPEKDYGDFTPEQVERMKQGLAHSKDLLDDLHRINEEDIKKNQ